MKKLLFIAAIAATFAACKNSPTASNKADTSQSVEKTTAEATGKDPSVSAVFQAYYDERMRLFPFEATSNGISTYNDQFPIDISDAYRDTVKQFYQKYKTQLAAVDASKLTERERMSYDILSWDLDVAIEGFNFNDHLMPINQFWGKTLDLGQLGSGEGSQPFKTTTDYDNWLKRISHFPEWADVAIANMKRGITEGAVLPKALVVKILPQLKPMAETPFAKHLFYQPIGKLTTNTNISAADKKRLTADYTKMVNEVVKPTYKKLNDFMQTEYLPKARTTSGISAVPKGKEYYAYLAKSWTTTTMTPDEIFEVGQKEVASRI
jgi:uncharacterized protein (DUF885 family)